jgi:aspartyl-tRNA(Asn)/glutamyl-tRNA(Gln) amidotransferase subunit A
MTILSMQIPENIKSFSAYDIGQLLQKKKMCPIDLVYFYFHKIESYKKPNPFTILTKQRAFSEAENSKKRLLEDNPLSLLDGVPVAWKDLFDFKDFITVGGSKLLENSSPAKKDADVVSLAKKAGLIQLGKTTTVEFALGGLGTNNNFITPENAIMKDNPRVPGGSSSGSGVALADGLCAASFGTDTGGSVRVPSAWNKLIGLKTSFGRVSLKGVLPLSSTLDTVGPLAKSVMDISLLFSILTNQPYIKFNKINLRNTKILVVKGMPWKDCDIEIEKAAEEAIKKLSKAGIQIIEKEILEIEEMHKILSEHGTTVTYQGYAEWKGLIEKNSDLMDINVLNRMYQGKYMKQNSIKIVEESQIALSKKLYSSIKNYDAILMPTVPILPPKINEVQSNEKLYDKYNMLALRNTRIGNVLPMCSISLPCPGDLPIGMMLSMSIENDEKLINLAENIYNIIK